MTNEMRCKSDLLTRAAVDEEKRQACFVASTDTIDSYGERVVQNWRLARFRNAPVVLYNHARGPTDLPIGTASVAVTSGRLEAVVTFVTAKANPLAERVFQSVVEGSLRMLSVGFRPHSIRVEMVNDEEVVVLDDNELFELSVTPIGANPDALAKAKSAASALAEDGADPSAIKAWETALEEALGGDAAGARPMPPTVRSADNGTSENELTTAERAFTEALRVHNDARTQRSLAVARGARANLVKLRRLVNGEGHEVAAMIDDDGGDADLDLAELGFGSPPPPPPKLVTHTPLAGVELAAMLDDPEAITSADGPDLATFLQE